MRAQVGCYGSVARSSLSCSSNFLAPDYATKACTWVCVLCVFVILCTSRRVPSAVRWGVGGRVCVCVACACVWLYARVTCVCVTGG